MSEFKSFIFPFLPQTETSFSEKLLTADEKVITRMEKKEIQSIVKECLQHFNLKFDLQGKNNFSLFGAIQRLLFL